MTVASGAQARGSVVGRRITMHCHRARLYLLARPRYSCCCIGSVLPPISIPTPPVLLRLRGNFDHLSKYVTAGRFLAVIEIAISVSPSVLMQYRQKIIHRLKALQPVLSRHHRICILKDLYVQGSVYFRALKNPYI